MKNTQILVLFLIGAILIILGVLFKINELSLASLFLIVGMTFTGVAIFLLVLKLIRKNDKTDSFLDS
ncbi:MAG: gliding motility protein GldL [Burkholderiales bacterium]|nr:gliding motility protein GldL [Flavobacterium sp.]